MKVGKNSIAWIPYGYMAIPFTVGWNKADCDRVDFILTIPVFIQEWAHTLAEHVLVAVHKANKDYMKSGDSKVFQCRHLWLTEFCKKAGLKVED